MGVGRSIPFSFSGATPAQAPQAVPPETIATGLEDEEGFSAWWGDVAEQHRLDPNPDSAANQGINYRMMFAQGLTPEQVPGEAQRLFELERHATVRPLNQDFQQFPDQHPFMTRQDGTGFSNVVLQTTEWDDRTYAIPTMVDGVQLTRDEANERAERNGLENYPSFFSRQNAQAWINNNHANVTADGTVVNRDFIPEPGTAEHDQATTLRQVVADPRFAQLDDDEQERMLIRTDPRIAALEPDELDWYMGQLRMKIFKANESPIPLLFRPEALFDEANTLDDLGLRGAAEASKQGARGMYSAFAQANAALLNTGARALELVGYAVKPFVDSLVDEVAVSSARREELRLWQSDPTVRRDNRSMTTFLEDMENYNNAGGWQPSDMLAVKFTRQLADQIRVWADAQEVWTGPLSDTAVGRTIVYTNMGVGSMLSIIPQIRIGAKLLGGQGLFGGTFRYFTARGAIDGSVDGFQGALEGAVHGAITDFMFKGAQKFVPGRVNKALATGILFGGQSGLGGAPPEDVAAQLFVGIGLGAMGIRKHDRATKEQLTAIAAKAEKDAAAAEKAFEEAQPKDLKDDTFVDPHTGQVGWAFVREAAPRIEAITSVNRVAARVIEKNITPRTAYMQFFEQSNKAAGIPKSHTELAKRIIDGQARSWAENNLRNVDEWYMLHSWTHGIEGRSRHGDLVLASRKRGPKEGSGKGTDNRNPIQLELPPPSEPRSLFEGWREPKDVIAGLRTMGNRAEGSGAPKLSREEHIERLAVRGRLERATGVLPELRGGVEADRMPEGVRFVSENTIEFTFQKGPNKGKHYVVGAKRPEQWTRQVEEYITDPAERERAFFWYEDTEPVYRRFFGTEDWLPVATLAYSAQQLKGPVGAFGDMLNVLSQDLGGAARRKKGGLAGPTLSKIIKGERGNFNEKLHDFSDSLLGKDLRSYWANQRQGGAPFVGDIHTSRDLGFLDGTLARGSNSGLRKQLTPAQLEILDRLPLDYKESASPGPVQYDYMNKWGNRLARHLNDTKFWGRADWKPRNAQAVGWIVQQKSVLQRPEYPIDAIVRNTRRVSMELTTEYLPYDEVYSQLTRQQQSEVTNRALVEMVPKIFDLIGYPLRATTRSGAGGWGSVINASGYIDVTGPAWMAEAVGRIVGYTYGQKEVYVSRPAPLGKTFGLRVLEKTVDGRLRDDNTTAAAVQRLFELDPRTQFGFSREVDSENKHGFNVLFPGRDPSLKKGSEEAKQNKADQETIKEIEAELNADFERMARKEPVQGKLMQALEQVEREFGVELEVEGYRSDLKILSNDWNQNRGEENNGYLEGLDALTGIQGLRGQVVGELAPEGRKTAERLSNAIGHGIPGREDPFTGARGEFGIDVARQAIRSVIPNLAKPERVPSTVRGSAQGNFAGRDNEPLHDPIVNAETGDPIGPRPNRPGEKTMRLSEFQAQQGVKTLESTEGGRTLGQVELPTSGISVTTPALVRLFEGAHIGTVVHELGHILRVTMTPEDVRVAEQFYKVVGGVWLPEQEERFAEAFEVFLAEGVVNDAKLGPIYSKFATMLRNVYKKAAPQMLDTGILDVGKKAQFERWLSPERARASNPRGTGREWVMPMTKAELDWQNQERPLVDVDRIYDASQHPSPNNTVERYADNINLTKIKGEGDIQSVLKVLAETVGRESTPLIKSESFRETTQLADELGLTVRQYIGSKGGRMPDAAELTAARSLLQAATRNVINKAQTAKETQAPMDLVEYHRARIVQNAVREQLSGEITKLARAFGSLRQVVGEPGSEQLVKMLDLTIDNLGGSERLLDSAIRVADLSEAGTAAITKQIQAELKPTLAGAMMETWIMGLLSGIKTNARNLISNQGMAMMAPPEAFFSATIGKARTTIGAGAQLLMGDRAPGYLTNPDRVMFGEAQARIHGYLSGFYGGMRLATKLIASEDLWNPITRSQRARNAPVIGKLVDRVARAIEAGKDIVVDPRLEHLEQARVKTSEMRVGQFERRAFGLDPRSESKVSQKVGQLIDDIGEVVRSPGSIGLESGDALYRSIGFMSEVAARAWRRAAREDPRGARFLTKAFRQQVNEYTSNPSAEDIAHADLNAAEVTFTNPLGPLGNGILKLRRTVPGMRLLIPFMLAPTNLNTRAVERSPAATMFKNVREKIKAGGAAGDTALARMTMGSMILAGFAHMAAMGLVTGDGPSDPALRSGWLDEHGERSFFWGDSSTGLGQWISYDVLEPWAALMGVGSDIGDTARGKALLAETVAPMINLLGFTANYAEIVGQLEPEDAQELAEIALQAVMKNSLHKSWWKSLDELSKVMADPDRNFERWRNAYVKSIVPRILTHVAQTQDPAWRDAHTLLDTLKSQIPGYSKDLAINRNAWGDPLHFDGGLGPDLVSPIFVKNVVGNPLYLEVIRLKLPIRKPHRRLGSIEIDEHEYSWLVETGGQPAKIYLMDVVTDKFAVNPRQAGTFTDPELRIPGISMKLTRDKNLLWSEMTNLEQKGVILGVYRRSMSDARELLFAQILMDDPDRVVDPVLKGLQREGKDRQRIGLDLNNDEGFYP